MDEVINWQPIETAPKETRVLVFGEIENGFGVWMTSDYGVYDSNRFDTPLGYATGDNAHGRATHWMPLPEPPAIAGETGTAGT